MAETKRRKSEAVLSVAFRGSPDSLKRLKEILDRALEEANAGEVKGLDVAGGWSQSGGWVREQDGWPQTGGWYLSKNDELVKVSQPDDSLEKVTKNVYTAISKAANVQ
jgi:hypothetical protein